MKEAATQRHPIEKMFVKRKIKSSKSGLKEQNNFDKAEREFEYLTREKEEAVKREGAWDYNAFFGQPGDDEWVREIAAKNLPDYLEHYNDLTFGVPNVGVIIKTPQEI